MFYFPADEEKEKKNRREGREGEENYMLIFHKWRLKCQLVLAFLISTKKKKQQPKNNNNKIKNGELSVIFFENLLQLSLSSQ